jgi:CspA family cold shock protein
MAKGTVKFFDTAKGFGFLTPQGGGKDVLVDIKAVKRAGMTGLEADQVVEYETETDKRSGKLSVRTIRPA